MICISDILTDLSLNYNNVVGTGLTFKIIGPSTSNSNVIEIFKCNLQYKSLSYGTL